VSILEDEETEEPEPKQQQQIILKINKGVENLYLKKNESKGSRN
jgi:hypothetical protein